MYLLYFLDDMIVSLSCLLYVHLFFGAIVDMHLAEKIACFWRILFNVFKETGAANHIYFFCCFALN